MILEQFSKDILDGKGFIRIPNSYNHQDYLNKVLDDYKKKSQTWGFTFCEKKRKIINIVDKLEAGKEYGLKVFRVNSKSTAKECYEFLELNNALFVGVIGLNLIHQLYPNFLTSLRGWISSFDRKENLIKKDSIWWIPAISENLEGKFDYGFHADISLYGPCDYLICIHNFD